MVIWIFCKRSQNPVLWDFELFEHQSIDFTKKIFLTTHQNFSYFFFKKVKVRVKSQSYQRLQALTIHPNWNPNFSKSLQMPQKRPIFTK